MKIYNNIIETIGNTPLVRLNRVKEKYNLEANLYAKVEFFNPGSSVKDRIAKAMIEDAEEKGLISKGTIIIEPTSGNTGIGLAMVGAAKGYEVILVMPDSLSVERRKIMTAFGAKLILTEGSKGMKESIRVAKNLQSFTPNSYMPYQFENMENPKAHYKTTGKEIYEALEGKIDIFIAGIGTGGTISGVGTYLKEKDPSIKVIGIEPYSSQTLTKGEAFPHKIQGIGAGFVPKTLDTHIYDEIMTVSNEDAYEYTKVSSKIEGIFVGISSGAALAIGIEVALKKENKDKNIVIVFPDTGERYLSSTVFND
ncbi:MAG: cysteine synthase A [Firmicutes bacterium]|nr:cysteine synthase A [Bacillota bacterium]